MAIKYTEEQYQAIHAQGQDILVSAGAGSGKTAVLTARVIRKIKEGTPLENLVILTFTNKAAEEMKSRIRTNIAALDSMDEALMAVDVADIKTFDAYALSLLRQYGHILNIPNTLSILEQSDASLIKTSVADDVLEAFYTQDKATYADFIKRRSGKDDETLKSIIISIYDALMYFNEPEAFKARLATSHFTAETFEMLFKRYEAIVLEKVERLNAAISHVASIAFEHEKIQAYQTALYEAGKPLRDVNTYDALQELGKFKLPALPRQSDDLLDAEKALLSDKRDTLIKPLVEELFGKSGKKGDVTDARATHYHAFLQTKDDVHVILSLVEDFERRYYEAQKVRERFDYATVARLVVELLQGNPSLRKRISEEIDEIMVDEYQDTNALQEQFLSLIKRDNLYMVGDVKQSIYRFRNADPSIFSTKYRAFKEGGEGLAIDLNANFRSRSEVLDTINAIFSPIMDETIGGITYDSAQALKAKNTSFDTHKDSRVPYGLTLHTYDQDMHEALYKAELSKEEIELLYVARHIKNAVEGGMQIKEDDTLRNARYGDFAILIDRGTAFDTARRVFHYTGVPLNVHKDAPLTRQHDIMMLKSLFTLIGGSVDQTLYNQSFKHALMSVGRSFIGLNSDDALINQVLALPDKHPGMGTIASYATEAFHDFLQTIESLGQMSQSEPLSDIVEATFATFDIYVRAARTQGTTEMTQRFDQLKAMAVKKSEEGMSLSEFVEYFRAVGSARDLEIESASPTVFTDEHVNLMTVHKSKGLEFPVVYMVHLYKNFKFDAISAGAVDETLGIMLPHDNEGYDKSFVFAHKATLEKTQTVSERMRILYVALTRASEQLHLIHGESEDASAAQRDEDDRIHSDIRRRYRNFSQIIESLSDVLAPCKHPIDLQAFEGDRHYASALQGHKDYEGGTQHKAFVEAPPAAALQKEQSFSQSIDEWIETDTYDVLERGNRLHDALEHIDFFAPIDPQLEQFDLSEDDKETLRAFFNHETFASVDYQRVFKEYPFAFESEEGPVSGFIDLLLETDDAFIIIDYKLKNIDKSEYDHQIKGYAALINALSDKPVRGYLYSLLEGRFKHVL